MSSLIDVVAELFGGAGWLDGIAFGGEGAILGAVVCAFGGAGAFDHVYTMRLVSQNAMDIVGNFW